ncbi:hypothetical protein PR202_gb12385 [Eleusine coracana subsp. coracana]|uniref:MSP domain-containing protein n=1 Tax=Eleusine coracana subsp. coracana TaxID=191504 RepID=A0AAV5EP85_ELECO|nr:hypothetical protein PR202_gb12385 [Eleusine coracana subsp. coracana]
MLKGSEKPRNLSLTILKYITNDFSDERKIGNGGCGEVYKKISCLEDMLGIEPLELHFLFESNQLMSCSLHLTNNTDDYIVFSIQATNPQQYYIEPKRDGVPPRSKCSVTIMVEAQEHAPKPKHCMEELIVQSTRVDEGIPTQDMIKDLFDEQKNNKSVDKVSLTVVFDEPQAPEDPEHELLDAPLEGESSKYQGTRKASTIKAEMEVSVQTSSQVTIIICSYVQ